MTPNEYKEKRAALDAEFYGNSSSHIGGGGNNYNTFIKSLNPKILDIWTQKFPVDDEYYRRSGTTQLNREVAQNNKNENGSFIMKNAVITSQRNYGWHWYLGSKGTIHYVNKQNTNSYMARDDDHYVYFFSCLFPIFEYFEPPHF